MEYKIIERISTISKRGIWFLELNIVQWGENQPKLDLRTWNEDHSKCGKGITLTNEESKTLLLALQQRL